MSNLSDAASYMDDPPSWTAEEHDHIRSYRPPGREICGFNEYSRGSKKTLSGAQAEAKADWYRWHDEELRRLEHWS